MPWLSIDAADEPSTGPCDCSWAIADKPSAKLARIAAKIRFLVLMAQPMQVKWVKLNEDELEQIHLLLLRWLCRSVNSGLNALNNQLQ